MELRAFAEQVLFATTLEEKLQTPDVITDERPGTAIVVPEMPNRPANLTFKPHATGKSEFPGLHRLEDATERGKLLHFFGNHELLATELMALVLLKFPDAPAAFRKGLFQTLKDEQEHTRLYMARMKACGVEFGDFPVSGYFWRCIAPMQHPIDYVAGLCLTFEQANLDFAGHYGRNFATVGDADSAKLLQKIYHDEIGHVAYGLKWFRRWKNPNQSDWEAFCQTLKFPLSPQRAKGFSVNVEGRRAAGLDPQFIAELNVYSQSRGRTPSVYVFNAFTEGFLAQGKKFNPTKLQAQLARDLENLPQFLCRQDDIVLVRQKPSVEFLSRIKQAGYSLPEFAATDSVADLQARKLGSLRPWAWGPDSQQLLKPIFASVSGEKRSAEQRFNANLAELYSKAWSADLLRKIISCRRRGDESQNFLASQSEQSLLTSAPTISWLCSENEVGIAVNSLSEAQAVIAQIRARGHHKIMVKEAYGVAGSNALRLFEPELLPHQLRWLENTFAHERQLVVEPWLERVLDFSVQLEMTATGLKLCGYTGLLNDARGQFQANFAESHHHKRIPTRIVSLFTEPKDISSRLLEFYDQIFAVLAAELRRVGFVGPLGIDAFVYRDASGAARLKPIVEINPRYTMGRVLVELMHQSTQASCGVFRLLNQAQLRAAGFENFPAYARMLAEKFPLQMEGEPVPRIREGALCLNDPTTAQTCLGIFHVTRHLASLVP